MSFHAGSIWRKWDLHIHTPSSIVQNYGGDRPEIWEKFISELESLPADFKAIGINDYLFLDGYEKVKEYKSKGRLKNIELILPVVELRLDIFGGHGSQFNRINLHVIFSNELDAQVIRGQFLSQLDAHYWLSPEVNGEKWNGVVTRDSLQDLGKKIKGTSPDAARFSETDLQLGFNNLCVSLKTVRERLEKNTYLDGKYMLAIGKTEWHSLRWNDASIATKKSLINECELVFTAAQDVDSFVKSKSSLSEQAVNDQLLDCSDAHSFSKSPNKDRIGRCLTWIKADLTFEGLRHAVLEYENRIYVGDEPPKKKKAREESNKFLDTLSVRKKSGSRLADVWFDFSLDLNPDLVAVIGNKGNGKSALADILGLLTNTKNQSHFSFLNTKKFRNPKKNLALEFEGALKFKSGKGIKRDLSGPCDPNDVELAKFIPQNLLETICNEISSGEASEFDRELQEIIFSHVPEKDRLGQNDLSSLVLFKTTETKKKIQALRVELSPINEELVQLEEMRTPEYLKELEGKLNQRKEDLDAHEAAKPAEIVRPDVDTQTQENLKATYLEIDALEKERDQIRSDISDYEKVLNDNSVSYQKIALLKQKINNLKDSVGRNLVELKEIFLDLGMMPPKIDFSIDTTALEAKEQEISALLRGANEVLADDGVKKSRLLEVLTLLAEKRQSCDEPTRVYQVYLENLRKWEERRSEIIGTQNTLESIEFFERRIKEISQVVERAAVLRDERTRVVQNIYEQFESLKSDYSILFKPVQNFVSEHTIVANKLNLMFDVAILAQGLVERFLDSVDRSSAGFFYGREESERKFKKLLSETNFDSWDSVLSFLSSIQEKLERGEAEVDQVDYRSVKRQLKKAVSVHDFYNYIYGLDFLIPKYTLRLADRDIDQLSPGEKGTLLLAFYLLVDKRDTPLIIDQPEDNLDNQTVFDVLVPAVRDAKMRRQIIMVTHNPNLAVVCDAEQVIHASINKADGHRVTYITGSIENASIKQLVIDVLEGTNPAFENRKSKYVRARG